MFLENYIGVAGMVGAGKSTLTVELAQALGFETVMEEVADNPYLESYYADMGRYASIMQIWLLTYRFRQYKLFSGRLSMGMSRGVVQDRTIWEGAIFARMLNKHPQKFISDLDYQTYLSLFENVVLREVAYPQLLIYLDCSPEMALKRINLRGRPMERGLDLNYLASLRQEYLEFLTSMEGAGIRVLRLDWNNPIQTSQIISMIPEYGLKIPSFTRRPAPPAALRAR